MKIGKIITVDQESGVSVLFDDETEVTNKKYQYISSYYPNTGDRIIVEEIGDSYVVLGKVTSNISEAGIAVKAESAEKADISESLRDSYSTNSQKIGISDRMLNYTNSSAGSSTSYKIGHLVNTYGNKDILSSIAVMDTDSTSRTSIQFRMNSGVLQYRTLSTSSQGNWKNV